MRDSVIIYYLVLFLAIFHNANGIIEYDRVEDMGIIQECYECTGESCNDGVHEMPIREATRFIRIGDGDNGLLKTGCVIKFEKLDVDNKDEATSVVTVTERTTAAAPFFNYDTHCVMKSETVQVCHCFEDRCNRDLLPCILRAEGSQWGCPKKNQTTEAKEISNAWKAVATGRLPENEILHCHQCKGNECIGKMVKADVIREINPLGIWGTPHQGACVVVLKEEKAAHYDEVRIHKRDVELIRTYSREPFCKISSHDSSHEICFCFENYCNDVMPDCSIRTKGCQ